MDQEKTSGGIVTLTTDWKHHDFYIGMIKGQILSACPDVNIVDLAHNVPSFNLQHAAFIVQQSFSHFPAGSMHLIPVNSESGVKSRLLAVEHNGQYFVIPDNGIIGLLFHSIPERVFEVKNNSTGSFSSVQGFAHAVKELYNGKAIESLGALVTDYDVKIALRATIDESVIIGSIVYIDSYYNAITNISKTLFEKVGQGRNFYVYVQSNYNRISKLSLTYDEVDPGELLGLFNSAGLLEIAIRDGYAAEMLSLSVGGSVRVNFLKDQ